MKSGIPAGLAMITAVAILVGACSSPQTGEAESGHWPQFRGPRRDGVSRDLSLRAGWPPKEIWRAEVGEGYSGIAVHKGRVFTMYGRGADEWAVCLSAQDGHELWRFRSDAKVVSPKGNGPRATPAVDRGMVYVLGARGKLNALDMEGKRVWFHDLEKEYQARRPQWGNASSPLIEQNLLVVQAGGSKDSAFLAFDKLTGEKVWSSQSDLAGYSSPLAVDAAGQRQLLFFSGEALVSLAPADGQLLWRVPWQTPHQVNAAMPLFVPPDRVFVSSAYDIGAGMFRIRRTAGRLEAEEAWRNRAYENLFHSSVYYDGHIYGFDNTILNCLEADTGRITWRQRGFGHGSLIVADGHLIILGEEGLMAIAEASPQQYIERGRMQVLQGKSWPPPSLAEGRLYVRDQEELVCLDLRQSAP